ncbi:MAG: hypothetical protein WD015_03690 [Gaiellaceae bacterium]
MADPSETTQVSHDPSDPQEAELLGAVRALSVQVGGIQAELHSLRSQRRPLPPSSADAPGWEDATPARRESSTWMRSLDGPGPRAPAVPRVLLEVVFLIAVAVGAALANLQPVVIVVVMALAWLLVVVAEWTAAQAARRRAEASHAPLAGVAGGIFVDDPSWFAPPGEHTGLKSPEDTLDGIEDTLGGEDTGTRLPAE